MDSFLKEKLENAYLVCQDCGSKYSKKQFDVSTWYMGECSICGERKIVTEARDFYYFKYLKKI